MHGIGAHSNRGAARRLRALGTGCMLLALIAPAEGSRLFIDDQGVRGGVIGSGAGGLTTPVPIPFSSIGTLDGSHVDMLECLRCASSFQAPRAGAAASDDPGDLVLHGSVHDQRGAPVVSDAAIFKATRFTAEIMVLTPSGLTATVGVPRESGFVLGAGQGTLNDEVSEHFALPAGVLYEIELTAILGDTVDETVALERLASVENADIVLRSVAGVPAPPMGLPVLGLALAIAVTARARTKAGRA